mgnify:CR=1 FL=1
MIVGGKKGAVIQNIKSAAGEGDWNRKVEPGDAVLEPEQRKAVVYEFLKRRNTFSYRACNGCARLIRDSVGWTQNLDTQIAGMENLSGVEGGAIITSNHFNPLDSTIIRKMVKKTGRNRLYTVSQDVNFAAPGLVGFLLYYADTLPVTSDANYMEEEFQPLLQSLLDRKQWVLIYPEQEMWFNYRKPRPPKRGAYYYAAKCQVPVVSCFVEMREKKRRDNDEFYQVQYILHVLPPIYPEPGKSVRENSARMMNADYEQKKQIYESVYQKELDSGFSLEDIAGWIPKREDS